MIRFAGEVLAGAFLFLLGLRLGVMRCPDVQTMRDISEWLDTYYPRTDIAREARSLVVGRRR